MRLTGLGCRVLPATPASEAQIFLADPDNGTVLVVRHSRDGRVAGVSVPALAAGNVVTESAVRSASRRLRFATSRIARTTVSPSSGMWDQLPAGILVRDLRALTAELDLLPPRLIRPRVEAESLRVIAIGEVGRVGYAPGAQRLTASITGVDGGEALISASYRAVAPAALDALASALAEAPRFVCGTVHRSRGTVVIDPLALVCGGRVIIPDLAPAEGDAALEVTGADVEDPLTAAVSQGLAVLAEIAHRGLRHLPASFSARLTSAAKALAAVGFSRAAADMAELATRLGANADSAVDAWLNAEIRLLTTLDSLGG